MLCVLAFVTRPRTWTGCVRRRAFAYRVTESPISISLFYLGGYFVPPRRVQLILDRRI